MAADRDHDRRYINRALDEAHGWVDGTDEDWLRLALGALERAGVDVGKLRRIETIARSDMRARRTA